MPGSEAQSTFVLGYITTFVTDFDIFVVVLRPPGAPAAYTVVPPPVLANSMEARLSETGGPCHGLPGLPGGALAPLMISPFTPLLNLQPQHSSAALVHPPLHLASPL